MAAIDFPASPTNGQLFTPANGYHLQVSDDARSRSVGGDLWIVW